MTEQTALDLEICDHRRKSKLGKEHVYCPTCGCHWYKGQYWSRDTWDRWLEMQIDDKYPWEL